MEKELIYCIREGGSEIKFCIDSEGNFICQQDNNQEIKVPYYVAAELLNSLRGKLLDVKTMNEQRNTWWKRIFKQQEENL